MKGIIKYLKARRGITLVWMALMLTVLLMLAALAIDFAYMYYVKNQLQVAADAASLAGAAELDGTNSTAQEDARERAWEFACKNTAADSSVYLVTDNGDPADNVFCNEIPDYTNLNIANSDTLNDDIVVGYWDGTDFSATSTPINAVRVRARRTSGSPGGPVSVFLGRILGWSFMSPSASAIASRKPLATPGFTLCVNACYLSTPVNLLIAEGGGPTCSEPTCLPLNDRMALTAFSDKQAPNVGQNGDVVDYIWGRKPLLYTFCPLCITTNNTGGGGQALSELNNAFSDKIYRRADKTFDSVGNVISWRVAVPLLDRECNVSADPCSACPPGCQGNTTEPYHVAQTADIVITAVTDKGPSAGRGVTINSINCAACPTDIPMSKEVALVK